VVLRIGESLSNSSATARHKVEAEDRTNEGVLARLRALAASLGVDPNERGPDPADGVTVGEWVDQLNSTFGQ
jgi:hypothetical protein